MSFDIHQLPQHWIVRSITNTTLGEFLKNESWRHECTVEHGASLFFKRDEGGNWHLRWIEVGGSSIRFYPEDLEEFGTFVSELAEVFSALRG